MTEPSAPAPDSFQKADSLLNRTFIGLLIAQFLAAFNDQAIHASAMFFAINKKTLTEEKAISLMPILFFAPWAIFCTLAGYFADKYSKRFSLVVWKFAEIGITGLALAGFILGSEMNMPVAGVWIVLSTVFLMGLHSTFFVPAKYGAMPEILRADLLSKGNGLLESLSFLATILGTVCGGFLSYAFHDNEYIIGLILLTLAVVGAFASLMIQRMPPANKDRPFPPWIYLPLWQSLKSLLKSKPLTFVLFGIAFFTFMLAFMRAAVYMLGESRIPRWNELTTSAIVGMTALGIGLGSPMAGWLSGKKVELGLIPVGAAGMIVVICLAALLLNHLIGLVICIILIGFFTGFYLVPMFTQLQHRAPKERKGEVIATSNFTNVVGAILASLLFYLLIGLAHKTGVAPSIPQTEVYTNGTLTTLQEDRHHRPAYAQVVAKDRPGLEIGSAVRPDEVPPLFDWDDEHPDTTKAKLIVSQRVQIAWNAAEEAHKNKEPAQEVRVSVTRYTVKAMVDGKMEEIPHYNLRAADEPLADVHDNRQLPRTLFLGAAVMTFCVLLLLIWLLPDLIMRTRWWVQSLGKDPLRVAGVNNLPGHGPVLLVTNAHTSERTYVAWASDRPVTFATDNLAANLRVLRKGVLALGEHAGAEEMRIKLCEQAGPELVVIPVACGRAEITFGRPIARNATSDEVWKAIQATGNTDEH